MKESIKTQFTVEDHTQARLKRLAEQIIEDCIPNAKELRQEIQTNLQIECFFTILCCSIFIRMYGEMGVYLALNFILCQVYTIIKNTVGHTQKRVLINIEAHKSIPHLFATIEQRVLEILDVAEAKNYTIEDTALAIKTSLNAFGDNKLSLECLDIVLPNNHYIKAYLATPVEFVDSNSED